MMFENKVFDDAETILDIRDLTVASREGQSTRPVLRGISLRIRRGETVCLVGESGSGKSVASLATMGLLPKPALEVTGGVINLEGRDILRLSAEDMRDLRARRISIVFQEPMTALNPVMPVGDQIAEVLLTHATMSGASRKRRVLGIMEQVRLPDVERIYASYPHQLSGGQRQRIMIAMALIMEPQLLIADEPTTALDVTTQKQILELIAELQVKNGTAVLFITHDMGVVAEIADTVYVMKDGDIVEHNSVESILRAPSADYTRRLLRAVPSLAPRRARPPADATALSVRNLTKAYSASGFFMRRTPVKAAQNITFRIAPGRTLGIVGESGSGKSTVARCLTRLIDPSGGEVRVGSVDVAALSRRQIRPYRKHIQIVFQDPYRSLNPRWRVGESLIEGPLNFGASRQEALAQASELLGLVGLPGDCMRRYPHQFSGGQRQRIAIARAIAMRPEVLVADEAVSALDVSVQDQVLNLLIDLQRKLGVAILFITHDLRVAAQLCDEIMVMRDGQVVEHGATEDVLAKPAESYTRALIAAAPGRGWDFANCRPL